MISIKKLQENAVYPNTLIYLTYKNQPLGLAKCDDVIIEQIGIDLFVYMIFNLGNYKLQLMVNNDKLNDSNPSNTIDLTYATYSLSYNGRTVSINEIIPKLENVKSETQIHKSPKKHENIPYWKKGKV